MRFDVDWKVFENKGFAHLFQKEIEFGVGIGCGAEVGVDSENDVVGREAFQEVFGGGFQGGEEGFRGYVV